MIFLQLNRKEYFNDICDEIRLFFPKEKIQSEQPASTDEILYSVTVEIKTDMNSHMTSAKTVLGMESETHISKLLQTDKIYVKRIEKRNSKICVFQLFTRLFDAKIPWGSLTGIRPTKLYRSIEEKENSEEAEKIFREQFTVSEKKIGIVKEIVKNQHPFIENTSQKSIDIYLHIPFCNSKCLYCSFPSEIIHSSEDERLTKYLEFLEKDIRQGFDIIRDGNYTIRSIYIGGGTPSVLSAKQMSSVLATLNELYYRKGMEFTVEAGRPDSLDREKFEVLKEYNVNRISINPQTMQEKTLKRLGRLHTPEQIISAYESAKSVGFETINMDLITGLPGENIVDFQSTLDSILVLNPENLTIHTLAIKRSSKLHQFLESYNLPEEDAVIKMVELGYEAAIENGYMPYYMYRQKYMTGNLENIGYSKNNHICIYNIDMMEETTSILAHGANAMSKRVFPTENRVERIPNPKDLNTYFEKLDHTSSLKRRLFVDSIEN